MSISDLFKYAMAHGLYTASTASPVTGLFMQTKSERLAKAESYKPFSEGDIKAIFELELPTKPAWRSPTSTGAR